MSARKASSSAVRARRRGLRVFAMSGPSALLGALALHDLRAAQHLGREVLRRRVLALARGDGGQHRPFGQSGMELIIFRPVVQPGRPPLLTTAPSGKML